MIVKNVIKKCLHSYENERIPEKQYIVDDCDWGHVTSLSLVMRKMRITEPQRAGCRWEEKV